MKKNTKLLIFSINQIIFGLVIIITKLIQYFDFTVGRFLELSFGFILIISDILSYFNLKSDKNCEK